MNSTHGLSEKTTATIHLVLSRYPEVRSAVLFGSRAKGNYRPGSDIDLALTGPTLRREIIHRIAQEFDDLPTPYKFSIAALDAIADSEVLAHIERVGIVFYDRDSPKETGVTPPSARG